MSLQASIEPMTSFLSRGDGRLVAIVVKLSDVTLLIPASYGNLTFNSKINSIGVLNNGKIVVGCENGVYIINGNNITDKYSKSCDIVRCSKYDIIFGHKNVLYQITKDYE
jgi:hypothetical protein